MLPRGTLQSARLAALRQARRPRPREGDLIKEARHGSAGGTRVDRTTRLVTLARMEGTAARSAREGFTKKLWHVPAPLRKPLTYDRGKELAEHERLAQQLAIRIFCADPYSPWPRGPNENTNGVLRQYLPKGTDVSDSTQRDLNECHRPSPEHATENVSQLCHAAGGLYAPARSFTRCTWNLKPPVGAIGQKHISKRALILVMTVRLDSDFFPKARAEAQKLARERH